MRRGYGDEMWTLACAADVAGLERAADLLLRDPSGVEYEGHRARAFAFALEGRTGEALQELNAGWAEEWPTAEAYGIDIARIHFLGGDPDRTLTALQLDARTTERAQLDDVVTLVLACVHCDRRLWRRGLRIALTGSAGFDRLLVPVRLLHACLRSGPPAAADPLLQSAPGS